MIDNEIKVGDVVIEKSLLKLLFMRPQKMTVVYIGDHVECIWFLKNRKDKWNGPYVEFFDKDDLRRAPQLKPVFIR